jgi:hypothetical protein
MFFFFFFSSRYIELLYFYCPLPLIANVGRRFYRFVVDTHLSPYMRRSSPDIDWLSAFSTLLNHFYENTTKHFVVCQSNESIFIDIQDAFDYSTLVIDTLLHHYLPVHVVKGLVYDLKLIDIIVKVIGHVWQQTPNSDRTMLNK